MPVVSDKLVLRHYGEYTCVEPRQEMAAPRKQQTAR